MSLANLSQSRNQTPAVKALICFFSYTGNTRKVALALQEVLSTKYMVKFDEIEPVREHGYIIWLFYSFLRNARVRIENRNFNVSDYELVCLGCPKWTFSCPPFNEYLELMTGCSGKKIVLFVTFGGFREKGFVARLFGEIRKKGAASISTLVIKRKNVEDGSYVRLVEEFGRRLLAN